MSESVINVPGAAADLQELIEFAGTYNGYQRFCSNPGELEALFADVERLYFDEGLISDALQVDYLRAWLFMLFRRDYFTGSAGNPDELELWRMLIGLIADKSGGTVPLLE